MASVSQERTERGKFALRAQTAAMSAAVLLTVLSLSPTNTPAQPHNRCLFICACPLVDTKVARILVASHVGDTGTKTLGAAVKLGSPLEMEELSRVGYYVVSNSVLQGSNPYGTQWKPER